MLQCVETLIRLLQLLQLFGKLPVKARQGFRSDVVFAGYLVQGVDALLDLLQPLRVEFHAVTVVAQQVDAFFQLDKSIVEQFAGFFKGGVDRCQGRQVVDGLSEQAVCGTVVIVQ